MDDTAGSTIASMIRRFREQGPTDAHTRKKEFGDVKDKFWWVKDGPKSDESESGASTTSSESVSASYEWIQKAPLTPRNSKPTQFDNPEEQRFRGVETLDEIIARDVEEFTSTKDFARISQERLDLRRHVEDDQVKIAEEEEEEEEEVELEKPKKASFDPNKGERKVERIRKRLDELEEVKELSRGLRITDDVSAVDVISRLESAFTGLQLMSTTRRNKDDQEELPPIMKTPPKEEAEVVEKKPFQQDNSTQVVVVDDDEETNQDDDATRKLIQDILESAKRRGQDIDRSLKETLNDIWDADQEEYDEETYGYDVDPIYGTRVLMDEIPESLDITMTCLKRRLHGKDENKTPKTMAKVTSIEALKSVITEKLNRTSDKEGNLPPLPVDYDSSIDLLTARLGRLDALQKAAPSLLKWNESTWATQQEDRPEYRALLNAFEEYDWDDDGLITLQDACKILQRIAEWIDVPLNEISEQRILHVLGLSFLGNQVSKFLTFAELKRAFDLIVPIPAPVPVLMMPKQKQEQEREEEEEEDDDDDDLQSVASSTTNMTSTSKRIGSKEIRELAEKLRRAQTLLVEEEVKEEMENKKDEGYPGAGEPFKDNGDQFPSFLHRPPPYNPFKHSIPTAPPASLMIGEYQQEPQRNRDEVVLKLSQIDVAVKSATIEFYKRRFEEANQMQKPPPPSVMPPPPVAPSPHVEFLYDSGRLRVRSKSEASEPSTKNYHLVEEKLDKASYTDTSQTENKDASNHFEVHEKHIHMAWKQLKEFEMLRKRQTTRMSIK